MYEGLLDIEWQDVQSIRNMLDSKGWRIFENKIEALLEYELCQVELATKDAVTPDMLPNLNEHLARRNVLKQILLIKQEMAEETDSDSPGQDREHNMSEDTN
jgi:hypothetical protein